MVKPKPRSEEQYSVPDPVLEQAGERKEEVNPKPQSEGKRSLAVEAKEQAGIKVEVKPQRHNGEEHSLSDATMKGGEKKQDEIKPEPRRGEEHLLSDTAKGCTEGMVDEVKPEPQIDEKDSFSGIAKGRTEEMVDEVKPDPRSEEEHTPSDTAAMEQVEEIKDEVEPEARSEEEYSLSDLPVEQTEEINDEVKPGFQSEEEHSFWETEEISVESELPRSRKVRFKPEAMGRNSKARRGKMARRNVNPIQLGSQSGEKHSFSDTEEISMEDELPKSQKARFKPKAMGRNPKAKRKNARRNVNPIGQLKELIQSCLPKIEGVRGDLHLTVTLNHFHGSYHAAAGTSTAPNVNSISIVNANTSNSCTCAQHGSEADSAEGTCPLFRPGKHWQLMST